jgi:hypothetical protein
MEWDFAACEKKNTMVSSLFSHPYDIESSEIRR